MRLLPLLVAALSLSSPVSAAPIALYTDRGQFDAAIGAHELFTDFPVAYAGGSSVAGNFGGIHVQHDILALAWGPVIGMDGTYTEGGAHLRLLPSTPITAIGFDLVSAWAATSPLYTVIDGVYVYNSSPPEYVPTTLLFAFETVSGATASHQGTPGSFVGALLHDDAFAGIGLSTRAGCLCVNGFTIDNLAVQSVPEPATLLLLSAGMIGTLLLRRRRYSARRK